ncbi:FK506-binding protein [Thalassoglobus neptunius]|uniref:peptidylprolyl isomerase n=1 Tax=Thalassoglobus neptunius TaxID=1938619 RepID=A0A5C5X400_9PLAN|nr:family 16 glycoside hydrolase [Thalassoglobus neptunius]TWT56915.1 FK506-binding protein [Thalassoglobus neptunius]
MLVREFSFADTVLLYPNAVTDSIPTQKACGFIESGSATQFRPLRNQELTAVVIKKSVICLGFALSVATGKPVLSDEPNSAQPTYSGENTKSAELRPVSPPSLAPIDQLGEKSEPGPSLLRVPDGALKPPLSPPNTKPGVASTVSLDSANTAREPGFESLLPGEDLEGWTVQDGRSEVWSRSGNMVSCRGLGGGWLRTDSQYSDFHVKFEYRLSAGGNSGFALRTPESENPSFAGIEIQLLDDSAEKYADLRPTQYTGSVYYQAAPQKRAQLNPVGEWNACEIICMGDALTVIVNGETINDVNLATGPLDENGKAPEIWRLSQRPPLGHLALQSHSTPVDFRNLRIKDLTVPTDSGVRFVELEDGSGDAVDPAEDSVVSVHYAGQLGDGRRFSDTRKLGEEVTVALDEVIPGWKHGLSGMKVGGRRRLIVPPEMGYGNQGVTNLIPPGATLVFEVELRGIQR